MPSRIAVIILNFFGHDDSLACVQSVLATLDAAIFLVDNSADPNERKILEKSFKEKDDVSLFFPDENLGFSAGVNLALREAVKENFQRFLLLNNDALLLQGAGEILQDVFEKYKSSLITPSIQWGEEIVNKNQYHKFLGLILTNSQVKGWGWMPYLTGCALAFDKNLLDIVGYLDETFFMYGEDVEYSYRAQSQELPLRVLDDVLVKHEGSQSSQKSSLFYEYHVTRSHFLLTFRLHKNPFMQAITLAAKGGILLIRAVRRCARYNTFVPFIAFLYAPFHKDIQPRKP